MVGYSLTEQTQTSRVLYINSRDAQKHTHTTHLTYIFKDAIHTRPGEGALVSLMSASVPYSFYNIRDGVNNVLSYEVTHPVGGNMVAVGTGTVIIDPGNYTPAELGNAVKTVVNNDGHITINVVYVEMSQKYTISTADATKTITLQFGDGSDTDTTPSTEFGINGNAAVVNNLPFISTKAVDVNGSVHALFLRTDLPTNSVFESQSGGASDVLGKIEIDTTPGNIISHKPWIAHESLIQTNHIKSLTIRLTDERNRLLNLNGRHFQVGILLKFVKLQAPFLRPLQAGPTTPVNEPNIKNKKKQRQRALKKGKKKVKDAVDRANTKKQSDTTPEKK